MPEASASVVISQPADTVWEYCLVPEHVAELTPGVVGIAPVSEGPPRVGTTWRGQMKALGRTIDWVGEFTRVDPVKATEFASTESPFGFTISATLDDARDGVRLTFRIHNDGVEGGAIGKVADALAIRAFQRSLSASARKLPRSSTNGRHDADSAGLDDTPGLSSGRTVFASQA
ncbi:SRPBCC family protein [Gordonia amicalis]|nr:SRPBCC family protein [Gordonia amicalis]